MRKLKILFFATTVAVASMLTLACGDDSGSGGGTDSGSDSPVNPPNPPPNQPPNPPPPPPGPLSFPGYVQDQILNHTTDNGAPDPSTTFDALADDPAFAFPASFF